MACVVDHDSGMEWDHDMIAPAARRRRQRRLLEIRRRYDEADRKLKVKE